MYLESGNSYMSKKNRVMLVENTASPGDID